MDAIFATNVNARTVQQTSSIVEVCFELQTTLFARSTVRQVFERTQGLVVHRLIVPSGNQWSIIDIGVAQSHIEE